MLPVVSPEPNKDNTDIIGVGLENKRCGQHYSFANVTMLRSIVVFDRDRSAHKSSRAADPSLVFGRRYGIAGIEVRNNQIVDKTGKMRWNGEISAKKCVNLPVI